MEAKVSPADADGEADVDAGEEEADEVDEVKEAVQAAANLPEGYIEWEAVSAAVSRTVLF